MTRTLIAVVAMALLLDTALGSATGATKAPRPVLRTRYQASQFLGDGTHLGWVERCSVHVYSLVSRKGSQAPACRDQHPQVLVLAGARTYWTEWKTSNAQETWTIFDGAQGHTGEVAGATLPCEATDPNTGQCTCYDGPNVSETTGGGSTFVYAVETSQCPGGSISTQYYRVVASNGTLQPRPIPNMPGSSLLYYGGGRIGLLTLKGAIEIRRPATGALVRRIKPHAQVLTFAFSRKVVAALVFDRFQASIARYSLRTGRSLGAVPLPGTIWSLEVSGNRVLLQGLHKIWVIERGKPQLVVGSRKPVWGSALLGRRALWFTDQGSHGSRIYEVRVP